MTKPQATLLRRLIQAERDYAAAVLAHHKQPDVFAYPHPDERWIEVFGGRQRTAEALEGMGLAELEGRLGLQLWVKLGAD